VTIDPAISYSFGIGLAALLIAGAAHKLRRPSAFFEILSNYRIAPEALSPVIGAIAIAAELAIAVGLLIPAIRSIAACAGAGLFAVYGGAIALNIARGRTAIDCGCSFGGGREGRLTPWLLARNGALALAALAVALPVGARALGWVDGATIIIFVAGAAALYAAFEALMALPAREA